MMPMPTKIPPSVAEVLSFMAKRGLTLVDLIEVGGEDLKSSDPKKSEKAKSGEKSWGLMAKLGVKYVDLENSVGHHPLKPSRAQRGEGVLSEVVENKEVFAGNAGEAKSLKNNNKTNDHSVGASERRLAPESAS
jgi:hypothetical protein